MFFSIIRFAVLTLILLISFWFRLNNLSEIPPVLLQKELKVALAAQVLNDSKTSEVLSLFSRNFGFINTQYIAPLPILFTTPFIKTSGFNPYAIRLPSVLIGIITIVMFYFFTKYVYILFNKNTKLSKNEEFFPLIATFFFAFSPWHIQISRIDTGVNLGLFFFLLGLFLSLKVLKLKNLNYFWILPFVAAVYSDYNYFIPSAATVICITFIFFTRLKFSLMSLTPGIFIAVTLLLPIFSHIYFSQIQIDSINLDRFFSNSQKATQRIEASGDTVKAKILNHSSIENTKYYFKNITDYLEPASVFVRWNYSNGYISRYSGLLHPFDLLFFLTGIIYFLRTNKKVLIFFSLFIASIILPQAIQKSSPDAALSILLLPAFTLVSVFGFITMFQILSHKLKAAFLLAVLLMFFYFTGRFTYFFFENSTLAIPDYYYGYQKAFEYVGKKKGKRIIITDATYGKDLPLYWLYLTKKENHAKKYMSQNNISSFDNYEFLKKPPIKYKLSSVYVQTTDTVPKYFKAALSTDSSEKKFQISVFFTPDK